MISSEEGTASGRATEASRSDLRARPRHSLAARFRTVARNQAVRLRGLAVEGATMSVRSTASCARSSPPWKSDKRLAANFERPRECSVSSDQSGGGAAMASGETPRVVPVMHRSRPIVPTAIDSDPKPRPTCFRHRAARVAEPMSRLEPGLKDGPASPRKSGCFSLVPAQFRSRVQNPVRMTKNGWGLLRVIPRRDPDLLILLLPHDS